jgi:hypothetical protein
MGPRFTGKERKQCGPINPKNPKGKIRRTVSKHLIALKQFSFSGNSHSLSIFLVSNSRVWHQ